MKTLILTALFMLSSVTSLMAQDLDWGKMEEKARKEYLITLHKEATLLFAPDFYKDYRRVEVGKYVYGKYVEWPIAANADKEEKMPVNDPENTGRSYYHIVMFFDQERDSILSTLPASELFVWEDNGQPMQIRFAGYGGYTFANKPYSEFKKEGVSKEKQFKDNLQRFDLKHFNPNLNYANLHEKELV